ncbi:tumor necrosis factor receptor superfamily member 10C-like [Tachysurus ichikawai]
MLVLYSSTESFVHSQKETTYLREISPGKTVLCKRCPPGYRLQEHCTEKKQTVCQPCTVGYYTEVWNYIYECLPCRWCRSSQVEVQKCTSTTNRKCGCKEGFYLDTSDICRPHTVCPRGYGVKQKGTPVKDTVCELCRYRRTTDGQLSCGPHTECNSDERLLHRGTNLENVCVSCSSIANEGWVKFIIQPFIEIFKNHSTRRLQRFIGNLTNSLDDCSSNQNSCFEKLEQWFSKATEEEVINLPKLMQQFNIKSLNLTTKIEKRLKTILDEVNLCRNMLPNLV